MGQIWFIDILPHNRFSLYLSDAVMDSIKNKRILSILSMSTEYDFPVELQTISTEPGGFIIPHRRVVIRTDTMRPLGIVSDKYSLLPHADVVDALRDTLKGQKTEEKIRLTHDGARMYLEIILPNETLKVEGDEIAMRLVIANSYDGSRKVNIAFGAYRLVCSNGRIVGRKFLSLSKRHVGAVTLEVADMRKQMTMLTGVFQASAPAMRRMATTRLVPSPKKFFNSETLHIPTYLVKIAKIEFGKAEDGTVWDAYNALTFAITHKMRKNNPDLVATLGNRAWNATKVLLHK